MRIPFILVLALVFLTWMGAVEAKMTNPIDASLIKIDASGGIVEVQSSEQMRCYETQNGYAAVFVIGDGTIMHERYNTTLYSGCAAINVFDYETSEGGEVMQLYFDRVAEMQVQAKYQMYDFSFNC